MSANKQTPTFNMKVVVQETGLKPDTLRAWERRYGIPNPQRTPGGHRLYSQFEIDMLKWMVARQNEGMSISHAIDLWLQLEREGQNPLLRPDSADSEAPAQITGERVDELRQDWLDACLSFNEYKAQGLLARAFALFPLETVCFKILREGLFEIGQGWSEGRITVQQEHFASSLAMRQLESLMAALPAPTRDGRLIVACPPEELHTFAPLMISLKLRRKGWEVVYLGANVPLDRMAASIKEIKPLMVIMSAQTLVTAATLLPMARIIGEAQVPLGFGGAVFNQIPQLIASIPGHFLGEQLENALAQIETLLQSTPPLDKAAQPSQSYQLAYKHFVEKRSAIEAYLQDSPLRDRMPSSTLTIANIEFGDDLEAALIFGDIGLVQSNLEWIHGLMLNNHQRMAKNLFEGYMAQYATAVQSVCDERAAPITAWLNTVKLPDFAA